MVTNYKTKEKIESKLVFEKQPDAALTIISQSGQRGYRANLFERGEFLCLISAEGFVSEQVTFNLLDDSLKSKTELVQNFELIPLQLNEILPFNKILFDVASFKLSTESMPELARLNSMLAENPNIKIRLEGHTDNQGAGKKSLQLAQKRIEEVKNWLVKKGISRKRIKLKAFGGEQRLSTVDGPDSRRANRRVEIRVIEI